MCLRGHKDLKIEINYKDWHFFWFLGASGFFRGNKKGWFFGSNLKSF